MLSQQTKAYLLRKVGGSGGRSGNEMEQAWCFLELKGNAAETGQSNFSFGFEIKEPM